MGREIRPLGPVILAFFPWRILHAPLAVILSAAKNLWHSAVLRVCKVHSGANGGV